MAVWLILRPRCDGTSRDRGEQAGVARSRSRRRTQEADRHQPGLDGCAWCAGGSQQPRQSDVASALDPQEHDALGKC